MAVQKTVVLDTNVLVSALLASTTSPPVHILTLVQNEMLSLCYDQRIWQEYCEVLHRPRFGFGTKEVRTLLHTIQFAGFSVSPFQLKAKTADPDDQAFYEVAALCHCPLVTGNKRHFPDEPHIMTPAEYLSQMRGY
ncbi:MAG: putative toxin-antitoxin system toxin component, PIN family [Coriobacteriia bacterium]|nr:putative toxin-antitoxin system toxin component, PIN family [Coriobacteriia bacterium]